MVNGQRRDLREADVTTIRQRRGDSLQNGALAGLCIGAGLTAILFALSGDDVNGGWAALGIAIYGGVGAGIGVGVDALIVTRQ